MYDESTAMMYRNFFWNNNVTISFSMLMLIRDDDDAQKNNNLILVETVIVELFACMRVQNFRLYVQTDDISCKHLLKIQPQVICDFFNLEKFTNYTWNIHAGQKRDAKIYFEPDEKFLAEILLRFDFPASTVRVFKIHTLATKNKKARTNRGFFVRVGNKSETYINQATSVHMARFGIVDKS